VNLGKALLLAIALVPVILAASAEAQEEQELVRLGKAIGAGLAVGLAGIGAGYAVGVAGAAAASAVTEKREVFGSVLLIVVLGEGIAIYGLLIAILVLLII